MRILNADNEYDQISKDTNVTIDEDNSVLLNDKSVITKFHMYFDSASDDSEYFDSTSEEEEDTENLLDEMVDKEQEDVKYQSIFDSNCVQFDEQIMTLETVEQLKNGVCYG